MKYLLVLAGLFLCLNASAKDIRGEEFGWDYMANPGLVCAIDGSRVVDAITEEGFTLAINKDDGLGGAWQYWMKGKEWFFLRLSVSDGSVCLIAMSPTQEVGS